MILMTQRKRTNVWKPRGELGDELGDWNWHVFDNIAVCVLVAQLCLTLYNQPMDCSLLVSSARGISQQEYWNALPFSSPGGSSLPRDQTQVSSIVDRLFTVKATREVHKIWITNENLLWSTGNSTQCSVVTLWERNPKKRGCMYICGWYTLLCSRNKQHCEAPVLQFKRKKPATRYSSQSRGDFYQGCEDQKAGVIGG